MFFLDILLEKQASKQQQYIVAFTPSIDVKLETTSWSKLIEIRGGRKLEVYFGFSRLKIFKFALHCISGENK